jgi:hypothetical protein
MNDELKQIVNRPAQHNNLTQRFKSKAYEIALVERVERKRSSGKIIPVGNGFQIFFLCFPQDKNLYFEFQKPNLHPLETRDILFPISIRCQSTVVPFGVPPSPRR